MISKIKWIKNRWMAMEHPQEDVYRIKQFVQHHIWDKFSKSDKILKRFTSYSFENKGVAYSKESLKSLLKAGYDFKQFPLYDFSIKDISKVDNWHGDLKNGIDPAIGFSHSIPFQNFEKAGDFRYISVVSRLHHFPFFAALSFIDVDNHYQEIIKKQLTQWEKQNPYMNSINWRSGIEIGIRGINLVFTRVFIEDDTLTRQLDKLILLHFFHLTKHLSLYSSANNHLLAELTGIFVITSYYRFTDSNTWNKKAYESLLEELYKQTHTDGFSKEQSSHYHAEVLNMYLLVFSIAKSKYKLPDKAKQRIGNMGEFLHYLLNKEGTEVISLGDSDEGELLYPYFDPKYNIYSSVLNDVSLLLEDSKYLNVYNHFDIRNYLIQGETGNTYYNKLSKRDAKGFELKTKLFKDSGYCFFIENNTKLCFDVGEIGLGKLAAHGHSDLLHFTLDYKNQPFIIDPGTYQYHSRHTYWRNYFRGITAHNTISVNNKNHALSAGRMIWLKHPKVNIEDYKENEKEVYCMASHNAFLKEANTNHSRKILYNRHKKSYEVTDILENKEESNISFALHFHPSIKVIHEGTSIILINPNKLRVVLNNNYFSVAKLYKGDEDKPLGWFSNRFNSKLPATSLLLELKLKGKNTFETSINFH